MTMPTEITNSIGWLSRAAGTTELRDDPVERRSSPSTTARKAGQALDEHHALGASPR